MHYVDILQVLKLIIWLIWFNLDFFLMNLNKKKLWYILHLLVWCFPLDSTIHAQDLVWGVGTANGWYPFFDGISSYIIKKKKSNHVWNEKAAYARRLGRECVKCLQITC